MLKILSVMACMAMVATSAQAQSDESPTWRPYMFVAPGGASAARTPTLHAGGGFDAISRTGLGGGVESGYVGPFPDRFDYGIGLLSLNGSYHRLAGSTVDGLRLSPAAIRHRCSEAASRT